MNIEDLKKHGALLEGHFELSSGLHSDKYIQCAKLLQTYEGMNIVDDELAKLYVDNKIPKCDVVIGGAYGGIRFAHHIAMLLGKHHGKDIRGIFCERVPEIEWDGQLDKIFDAKSENAKVITLGGSKMPKIKSGKFQLRIGFEINKGDKVLIAEDVTTTGKSIGEVAELVKEHGGEIVGAISIIDRRLDKNTNGETLSYRNKDDIEVVKPFISLIQLDINTWKLEDCPLCEKNCETCADVCVKSSGICKHWRPKYPLVKPGSKTL